jgi:thiamine-monophosphate kinase
MTEGHDQLTAEQRWIDQLGQWWPDIDTRHDAHFDLTSQSILTTDLFVEEIHFSRRTASLEDIGWKAMAINISDCAASGASPAWAMVSVACPPELFPEGLNAVYQGIAACSKQYQCPVVGGDTTRAEKLIMNISLGGHVDQPLRRTRNIQSGDVLGISQPHGLSAAGLLALEKNIEGYLPLKIAHTRPLPQLKLGQALQKAALNIAAMDTSDGLADAILRFARLNQSEIKLYVEQLPLDPHLVLLAKALDVDPLTWVLYGGEDYGLCTIVPKEALSLFPELIAIGTVEKASHRGQAWLVHADGTHERLTAEKTYQHFEAPASSVSSGFEKMQW